MYSNDLGVKKLGTVNMVLALNMRIALTQRVIFNSAFFHFYYKNQREKLVQAERRSAENIPPLNRIGTWILKC